MTNTGTFKWLFCGDLQIPFHDKRAVELWLKVAKAWHPDAIDIVGDIDDQLEYSTFSDGTTDEFFNQLKANDKANERLLAEQEKLKEKGEDYIPNPELARVNPLPFIYEHAKAAKDFYTDVHKQHPDADKHVSLGNHDIRIFKYMDKKAPDLMEQVTPNTLWGLDDLGYTWRYYHEKPLNRFADIFVHHGDTVTDTGLSVKGDIEKYGISLVRGHDHKGGVVYKSQPMAERSLVGMGTGHLCDPNAYGLQYTINPAWQKGFGIAHIIEDKAFMEFIPMRQTSKGLTCIVDGKVFVN